LAACRAHGVVPVAYSPIAKGATRRDSVLARIGKAHGKTGAQVSLRWLVQQGIGAIPRSSKVERLVENIAIFDFALSDAEMAEIAGLARADGRLIDWAWSPKWD
jgi:diketogulonate reductase-like aldo/keto reductase